MRGSVTGLSIAIVAPQAVGDQSDLVRQNMQISSVRLFRRRAFPMKWYLTDSLLKLLEVFYSPSPHLWQIVLVTS